MSIDTIQIFKFFFVLKATAPKSINCIIKSFETNSELTFTKTCDLNFLKLHIKGQSPSVFQHTYLGMGTSLELPLVSVASTSRLTLLVEDRWRRRPSSVGVTDLATKVTEYSGGCL